MGGVPFHVTVMGRRFYEGDVPRLVKALERIADRLGALELGADDQVAEPDERDLGDVVPDETDEQRDARIRNVRHSGKRAAELIRAFDNQVVPDVSPVEQRTILNVVADFVEHAMGEYGTRR